MTAAIAGVIIRAVFHVSLKARNHFEQTNTEMGNL
jgi:hypothetical protein